MIESCRIFHNVAAAVDAVCAVTASGRVWDEPRKEHKSVFITSAHSSYLRNVKYCDTAGPFPRAATTDSPTIFGNWTKLDGAGI